MRILLDILADCKRGGFIQRPIKQYPQYLDGMPAQCAGISDFLVNNFKKSIAQGDKKP